MNDSDIDIRVCSVCGTDFDIECEGGISGVIGTFITVDLCSICYSGLVDMFE